MFNIDKIAEFIQSLRPDSVNDKLLKNFRNHGVHVECIELIQTMVDCIIQNMSNAFDANKNLIQFVFQLCKKVFSNIAV